MDGGIERTTPALQSQQYEQAGAFKPNTRVRERDHRPDILGTVMDREALRAERIAVWDDEVPVAWDRVVDGKRPAPDFVAPDQLEVVEVP